MSRIGSRNPLMARTEIALDQAWATANVMRRTGINPDLTPRMVAASDGMGGPEIPLDRVQIEGISDPQFTHAYLSAAAVLDQLNGLSAAMDHVPLTTPVSTATFDKSSGFGARVDPFTGRYAFHPGIDFAGPWGSVVHATAPGTVVFAGNRGGYGNMVEIDHGYGIHTRYGHLSAISVQVGAVGKGAGLGRVGSTGRSTGPHVHYEVWYDEVVKNPNNSSRPAAMFSSKSKDTLPVYAGDARTSPRPPGATARPRRLPSSAPTWRHRPLIPPAISRSTDGSMAISAVSAW